MIVYRTIKISFLAEAERFELSMPCDMPRFQRGGINHYPTLPLINFLNAVPPL